MQAGPVPWSGDTFLPLPSLLHVRVPLADGLFLALDAALLGWRQAGWADWNEEDV